MEDYPKTLLEFEEQFATEEACFEYLFKNRDSYLFPASFWSSYCQGRGRKPSLAMTVKFSFDTPVLPACNDSQTFVWHSNFPSLPR